MQNWYQNVNAGGSGGGSREPLPAGKYSHRNGKTLYIAKLLEPRLVGNDMKTTRHSFVVSSDDEQGSAFLKIDLQDYWLRPETIAIAFSKRGKDGQREAIHPDVQAHLDGDMLMAVKKQLQSDAEAKVEAANTPEEAHYDATEETIGKILTQIQINVGTIFRLCDWAGIERDPTVDLGLFETYETQFEGEVKHNTLSGKVNAEVSVSSKKANGQVNRRQKSTDFNPEEVGQ